MHRLRMGLAVCGPARREADPAHRWRRCAVCATLSRQGLQHVGRIIHTLHEAHHLQHHLIQQRIGAAGAAGEDDGERALRGEPCAGALQLVLRVVEVPDFIRAQDLAFILDEKRREALFLSQQGLQRM